MFHVTKMADYAVMLLCEFALSEQTRMSARDAAGRCGIGEPTAMKLLKLLARAGILDSVRGAGGGYHPARSPEHISLFDIISAVEGIPSVTDCQHPEHNVSPLSATGSEPCEYQQHCTAQFGWATVNKHINDYLKSVTVRDFINTCPSERKRQPEVTASG